jgi:hypothetical protein
MGKVGTEAEEIIEKRGWCLGAVVLKHINQKYEEESSLTSWHRVRIVATISRY